MDKLSHFYSTVKRPFVLVSALPKKYREQAVDFLKALQAPVYFEGVSGLREDLRLEEFRIADVDFLFKQSEYPVDGILRIGGVPTPSVWRDLEKKEGQLAVLSLSHLPFSGMSWGELFHTDYQNLPTHRYSLKAAESLLESDRVRRQNLSSLFRNYPRSEPSLFYALSQIIPPDSLVYLGNSLPIREWDLAACDLPKNIDVWASRGLNGIDGQLSTFFGLCTPRRENWGIVGDLTALYDLAAPWIISQLPEIRFQLVVVNNGGGMIFSHMGGKESFLNRHSLSFEPVATLWGIPYERWERIGEPSLSNRLIEIVPDPQETALFWEAYRSQGVLTLVRAD